MDFFEDQQAITVFKMEDWEDREDPKPFDVPPNAMFFCMANRDHSVSVDIARATMKGLMLQGLGSEAVLEREHHYPGGSVFLEFFV